MNIFILSWTLNGEAEKMMILDVVTKGPILNLPRVKRLYQQLSTAARCICQTEDNCW